MRILHVLATDQRRGAEVFASDLMRALEDAGAQQRRFVLRKTNGGLEPSDGRGLGRPIPGVNVRPSVVRDLVSASAEWKPDVIQAHGGEALKYSVLASPWARAPIVYRRIGTAPRWIRRGPRRRVQTALMRRAAYVVAVADAVRSETIARFRISPAKVVTIPNGIDPERMEPTRSRTTIRGSLGIPPDARVLLSMGALTWEKDPLTHVEIGRRVLQHIPDAMHLLVGDGPMRDEVGSAIARTGVGERTRVLGTREDVADLLLASDVLLFTSRPDGMEGMPAVVIEAGMAGLPVAGYAVAGVAEVVFDGVSGILVEPNDLEGLTDRLIALLNDPAELARMGGAGRERCRERFDIRTVAPRYLGVYGHVVEQLAARPSRLRSERR